MRLSCSEKCIFLAKRTVLNTPVVMGGVFVQLCTERLHKWRCGRDSFPTVPCLLCGSHGATRPKGDSASLPWSPCQWSLCPCSQRPGSVGAAAWGGGRAGLCGSSAGGSGGSACPQSCPQGCPQGSFPVAPRAGCPWGSFSDHSSALLALGLAVPAAPRILSAISSSENCP